MSRIQILLFGILLLTASAAISADRQLQAAEKLLNTDGPIAMQFHSALYYPNEITLLHDGFLVGIEKAEMNLITKKGSGDLRMKHIDDAGLRDVKDSEKLLRDHKIMFVSHVLSRYSGKTCDLYNAYRSLAPTASHEFDPSCPAPATTLSSRDKAYEQSWSALDSLKTALKDSLSHGEYDDIVVITMGWNTPQDEAIRNINTLTRNLTTAMREAGKYSYKPLLIGVTWPSQWTNVWVDPAIRIASFPTKAEDADQVGLTWLAALLHETIPDAQRLANSKLKVIAIGHSFGSRAISTAACVGPAIYNTDKTRERVKIPVVINLEGAFKVRRVFATDQKRLLYPGHCANVGKYVMTASSHDKANGYAKWGAYIGEASSYKSTCESDPRNADLDCVVANAAGGNVDSPKRLVYVLADDLIYENAYLTGGGAHSDIFRKEHGQMIANVIRNANPDRVLRPDRAVHANNAGIAQAK